MCDLTRGLPGVKDNSVKFIFSEHFIEHLTLSEFRSLLRECFRVMEVGGVIRLSTPNLRVLCNLYLQGDISYWAPTWEPKTPCQLMNEGMRLWEHKFLFDEHELTAQLLEVGFVNVEPAPWHDSRYEELRGLEVRPFKADLILEATKGSL